MTNSLPLGLRAIPFGFAPLANVKLLINWSVVVEITSTLLPVESEPYNQPRVSSSTRSKYTGQIDACKLCEDLTTLDPDNLTIVRLFSARLVAHAVST